jgi:hypothetical protein
MDVTTVALDKAKATELYNEYKAHRHYSTPIDDEIRRAYKAISQGKVVIQALESIKAAGVDEKGLPRLAIAGATAQTCVLQRAASGSACMEWHPQAWRYRRGGKFHQEWPAGTFQYQPESFPVIGSGGQGREWRTTHRAMVPLIPVHLRPRQALEQYHILFEAEWEPIPPRDPYLLRRIGKADLWLVVAAWDLTDVERAALATRVSVQ